MRLFIAIDIPEEIKEKLVGVYNEMSKLGVKFIPVDKRIMHITLNFIGEVDEATAERAKEAVSKLSLQEFEAEMRGISYFSPSFIKVIFADFSRGNDELKRIFYLAGSALSRKKVPYQVREYVPHVTLARVKSIGNKLALLEFIKEHADFEFGSFKINEICLKKSDLSSSGPVYTDLLKLEF